MSRRYTYSRVIETIDGVETFTAEQFDSFDEAKNAVDKGIYDRKLALQEKDPRKDRPTPPPIAPSKPEDGGNSVTGPGVGQIGTGTPGPATGTTPGRSW